METIPKIDYAIFKCIKCEAYPQEAMESNCCAALACEKCLKENSTEGSGNNKCQICEKPAIKWQKSTLARKILQHLPTKCNFCQNDSTFGTIADHIEECPNKMRACRIQKCSYKGLLDDLLTHVKEQHSLEFALLFDEQYTVISDCSVQFDQGDNILQPITNTKGRLAKLGDSTVFYCKGSLPGSCECCNGECGPTNGCCCRECMDLTIKYRKLAPGYYVNKEGFTTKRHENGNFYCGRRNEYYNDYDLDDDDDYGNFGARCSANGNGISCNDCATLKDNYQWYQGLNDLK